MTSFGFRGRRVAVVFCVGGLSILLIAAPAKADVATWTDQADFEDGTLVNLDAASTSGELRLSQDPNGWTKVAANPVLDVGSPGSWDETALGSVTVISDGGVFKMWYSGCSGTVCGIGYAISSDGLAWTKYGGNPVLAGDPGSSWADILQNPSVLKDGDIYRLWFSANNLIEIRIGYATSPDGISWTMSPNPALSGGPASWDAASVSTPAVIREGPSFTMWYSGHAGDWTYRMGRATSSDGINWTKDPANPIMSPTFAWEEARVHPMQILVGSSAYELYYYAGLNYVQIGHAVSPDGIGWSRSPTTPILSPGLSGWDSASLGVHTVLQVGAERWMWYSGSDGTTRRIGLAKNPSYFFVGMFTSSTFDSGDNWTRWSLMEWVASLPIGTELVLQARSGNRSAPDLQWSDWATVIGPGRSNLTLPRARHFQVNVVMLGNGRATPVLSEIRLTYHPTVRPGPDPMPWVVLGIVGGTGAGLAGAVFVVARRRHSSLGGPAQGSTEADPTGTARSCPRCGSVVPPESQFCGRCGQGLP